MIASLVPYIVAYPLSAGFEPILGLFFGASPRALGSWMNLPALSTGSSTMGKTTESILRNGDGFAGTCDDLRLFSREEAPEREPFDPNGTVQQCLRLIEHELRLADVQTDVSLGEERHAVVGDPNQILRAFLKLLINAKDATWGGGKLALALRAVDQDSRRW